MFPLKQRTLIRGCQAHIAAGLGCGADYVASIGTDVFAPFDGVIETYYGTQGGNWSRLIRPNGDKIEQGHLSAYVVKSGAVKVGQLIAKTGNTGTVTTGPHLHIQIINSGTRLDPEKYLWDNLVVPTCEQQLAEKIAESQLNYNNWQTELDKRKKAEAALAQEISNHKETIAELQATKADREKIVAERNMKFAQIKAVIDA